MQREHLCDSTSSFARDRPAGNSFVDGTICVQSAHICWRLTTNPSAPDAKRLKPGVALVVMGLHARREMIEVAVRVALIALLRKFSGLTAWMDSEHGFALFNTATWAPLASCAKAQARIPCRPHSTAPRRHTAGMHSVPAISSLPVMSAPRSKPILYGRRYD